jgi:peptidoglycan/LPS O-acetylase OafA/YrhL
MQRISHLDGLRGLACVQVILLHAFGGFLPALVEAPATGLIASLKFSPLRLLWDGDSAVFLFFALSGCVLTPAFSRHTGPSSALLAGRIVRFAIPALLATALGLAGAVLCGDAHQRAGALIGSDWLIGNAPVETTLAVYLRDGVLNALVLGYRGWSLWDGVLGDAVWPSQIAFDPPLWTLSVELQGSLLVLGLVLLRRRSRRLWAISMALATMILLRSPFLCFLVGHAVACHAVPKHLRLPFLGAGLAICWDATSLGLLEPWVEALAELHVPLFPAIGADLLERGFGASLIFAALQGQGRLTEPLRSRPVQWLGRLSFPVYLVHWPVLYGPGAVLAEALVPAIGPDSAGVCVVTISIAASFLMAIPVRRIDLAALDLARGVRRALSGVEPASPAYIRPA